MMPKRSVNTTGAPASAARRRHVDQSAAQPSSAAASGRRRHPEALPVPPLPPALAHLAEREMSSDPAPASLLDVPDDVLLLIIAQLPHPLATLGLVCRRLRELTLSSVQSLGVRYLLVDEAVARLLRAPASPCWAQLRTLSLGIPGRETLHAVAQRCPVLEELVVLELPPLMQLQASTDLAAAGTRRSTRTRASRGRDSDAARRGRRHALAAARDETPPSPLPTLPSVHRLNVTGVSPRVACYPLHLPSLRLFPALRELHVRMAVRVPCTFLADVAQHCPQLEVLCSTAPQLVNDDRLGAFLRATGPRLRHLELGELTPASRIGLGTLKALVAHGQRLEVFRVSPKCLRRCVPPQDVLPYGPGLQAMILRAEHPMRELLLPIPFLHVLNDAARACLQLCSFRHGTVVRDYGSDELYLPSLRNLRSVDISMSRNASMEVVASLVHLRTLRCRDAQAVALLPLLPLLEELQVTGRQLMRVLAALAGAPCASTLRTLRLLSTIMAGIWNPSQLSADPLAGASTTGTVPEALHLPALRVLEGAARLPTPQALLSLLRVTPALHTLQIYGSENYVYRNEMSLSGLCCLLEAAAAGDLPHCLRHSVQRLRLLVESGPMVASSMRLAASCTGLVELCVSFEKDCAALQDEHLRLLEPVLPQLRVLRLHCAQGLSADGVAWLLDHAPRLDVLELRYYEHDLPPNVGCIVLDDVDL